MADAVAAAVAAAPSAERPTAGAALPRGPPVGQRRSSAADGGVRGWLPSIICLLVGWVGGTLNQRMAMRPQPCIGACGTAESAPLQGLPALRVAVVDERKGPGAASVALHREAFAAVGFRVSEVPLPAAPPYGFDLLWSHHSIDLAKMRLGGSHRTNHIPGLSILCQKAQFGRLAHEHRLEYVPRYYTSSERDAAFLAADLQDPNARFVVKGRAHRGVRMMTADQVASIAAAVGQKGQGQEGKAPEAQVLVEMLKENLVQKFVTDGLLVDGHKFDFAVYVFIEQFAPSLQAYTLENILIRVVPKPFPRTEAEWSENKRLIVQDEYLTPWSMPTLRRLWTTNARAAFDDYILQTLQSGAAQPGGVGGAGLSEEQAAERLAAMWERVRGNPHEHFWDPAPSFCRSEEISTRAGQVSSGTRCRLLRRGCRARCGRCGARVTSSTSRSPSCASTSCWTGSWSPGCWR